MSMIGDKVDIALDCEISMAGTSDNWGFRTYVIVVLRNGFQTIHTNRKRYSFRTRLFPSSWSKGYIC